MRSTYFGRLSMLVFICLLQAGCGGGGHENRLVLRSGPDPLLSQQWHLSNAGQSGGTPGMDINVVPVWDSCSDGDSCRGEAVLIAVVDDGLEIRHPDLWMNVQAGASHNYVTGNSDPSPRARFGKRAGAHGTAIAGLVAARDDNDEGGRGVAPRANLAGYNLLESPTTINQGDAMVPTQAEVWVSTNSWGAPDSTGTMQPSEFNWRTAIDTGISKGRGGLGIVYTWAAGNGHQDLHDATLGQDFELDNSNYDGQANHHGVIAVGAVDHNGIKASYSEKGANLWLVAPGGDARCGQGTLVTTDLTHDAGYNDGKNGNDLEGMPDYTRCMNGTSAATPLVAGVAALMLQANSELSWRDVRVILARTARKNDPGDSDWTTNKANPAYAINHKYGFGLVNAVDAVELAKTWLPLPPRQVEQWPADNPKPVDTPIPDANGTELLSTIVVSGSQIDSIEWVDIVFKSDHRYAGDLEIVLISPGGTESRLSERHICTSDGKTPYCTTAISDADGIWQWRFGSARHLGEAADGTWALRVKDTFTTSDPDKEPGTGQWLSWRLKLHGHRSTP